MKITVWQEWRTNSQKKQKTRMENHFFICPISLGWKWMNLQCLDETRKLENDLIFVIKMGKKITFLCLHFLVFTSHYESMIEDMVFQRSNYILRWKTRSSTGDGINSKVIYIRDSMGHKNWHLWFMCEWECPIELWDAI